MLDDGEAKPGAAHLAGARLVDPEKSLEDPVARLGRDAGAVVGHAQVEFAVCLAGRDPDALAAVLDTVLDEVVECLKQSLAVGPQGESFRDVVFQLHLFFACHLPETVQHPVGELAEIHLAQVESGAAGLEGGQREDVLDQVGQPVGVVLDFLEEPVGGCRGVRLGVEQRLDVALDDGEWRAQLVADVGHELLPHILKALEPGEVVKHKDGAPVAALFFAERHAVNLQEALVEAGQRELLLHDAGFPPQAPDQLVGLMDANGLHDGSAGWIVGQPEQPAEGRVGKLDEPVRAGEQHALRHVGEHVGHPGCLGRGGCLAKRKRPIAAKPPQVQANEPKQQQDGNVPAGHSFELAKR